MWDGSAVTMTQPGTIEVAFRDLQPVDLDALAWAGGDAHLAALDEAMRWSWDGRAELIVGELPNERVIAHGGLDLRGERPKIWMLAVHEAWRSLGVGTAMLADLEHRAMATGASEVELTVEADNPRAKALYLSSGYVEVGTLVETWPLDDGRHYACVCSRLVKSLAR